MFSGMHKVESTGGFKGAFHRKPRKKTVKPSGKKKK